jgi:hypothetical protein
MELIERLKVILEAPGDDEDIDQTIDSEPEIDTGEDADVQVDDDAEKAASEGESEAEQLVDKEKGLTDWTGIANPLPGKTLTNLKGVKKPLENGWTTEEVISALKPTIIHFAKKYSTPTFSVEEGIAECMTGVLTAMKNDKGIAPFTSHVFRYLSTSVQRGAGKASNVSGVPQTKGGKYDHLAASRAAVSADAPMPGEAEETYSSQISSHYDNAADAASRQKSMPKLIGHFLNAPSVGLTEPEKLVLMATYGIKKDGSTGEPKTSKELADALKVSVVRISQIRTTAVAKIQEYVKARRFDSPDKAAQTLGLEESKLLAIAESFIRIIKETMQIELEMFAGKQIVEVKSNYRGTSESIMVHVNSDTYEVESVVNEENESVLGYIPQNLIDDAVETAKAKTTKQYFSEMVNNVIGMQSQPVFATINNGLSKPVSSGMDGRALKPGTYRAEINAPYKDGNGNTTYRITFEIYGQNLEETAISRIDDVDTGANDVSPDDVNMEVIDMLLDQTIRKGDIEPIGTMDDEVDPRDGDYPINHPAG